MAAATAIEDLRSAEPLEYLRATGLRPEDCYGFLPLDLDENASYMYLYRDRAEYAERRTALPGPEYAQRMGPFETSTPENKLEDVEALPGAGGLSEVIAQAQQMQQDWSGFAPGAPAAEPDRARIERIERLRDGGAINDEEYARLLIEAGGTPGDAPISKPAGAPANAPNLVMHRIYPGLRMRSSTRQLDHFGPRYRDALGLCPEDVYGVLPRSTRTSSTGEGTEVEWDDFWIVYRDREEYAAGREAWAREMNKKGKWPEPVITPGVAEPGSAVFDRASVKVEKDRWPREKVVMRKKGSDLADALREKIGKWGYEPEDSFGFCPTFSNGSICFAWARR